MTEAQMRCLYDGLTDNQASLLLQSQVDLHLRPAVGRSSQDTVVRMAEQCWVGSKMGRNILEVMKWMQPRMMTMRQGLVGALEGLRNRTEAM